MARCNESGENDMRLEAGLLLSSTVDEKKATQEGNGSHYSYNCHTSEAPPQTPSENMPSPRNLLVTFMVCLLVTFSLASAVGPRIGEPCHEREQQQQVVEEPVDVPPTAQHESTFGQLVKAASPDSLHRLLHAYFPDRYQHGVYASEHDALEAVHKDNAPLATTLAKLAKRQDPSGGTNTTDSSSSGPSQTKDDNPPDTTSETSNSPTETSSPEPTQTSTPPETTNGPDTTPQTSTTPKDTETQAPKTTSKPQTSNDSKPKTSSSKTTITSTLPDGRITVITSTSYFDIPPEATGSNANPSAGLQNSASRSIGGAIVAGLFGLSLATILII